MRARPRIAHREVGLYLFGERDGFAIGAVTTPRWAVMPGLSAWKVSIRSQMTGTSNKLAVAPMMDWTDRHCRFLHRQLSQRTLLYTEMVVADAVIHGDVTGCSVSILSSIP